MYNTSTTSNPIHTDDIRDWVRTGLWDQVPIGISVIGKDYRICEANRAFARAYGEWEGRPCYEVYKGRATHCDNCAAARTFSDGRVRIREELGVLRDGKQSYYLVHMVPLVHDSGEIPYIIEMSTDITATKILEQEKLEAERLAAVGQTVAGLAHGIKNVIMGLEGGVYVVRTGMQKADSERILRGWHVVEENIERISAFVKEFLDFAKGREAKVTLLDPNLIVAKVVDLFRDGAELAGIELTVELGQVRDACMDEEGIHTCLTNLVSNALDACAVSDRPGGKVVVSTCDCNDMLVFQVSDDGTGMDAEISKKVFTNFFSTKGSEKGTGLGLLTTRKIVQQHGGAVSFVSTEGEGSVFRLEFHRERLPKPEPADNPANGGT
ncbi:MAG: PAS domain-containing sensor histidine kinase [Pseudomonadota bacterium]